MARWVIDSSVLIDHLRGDPRATRMLVAAVRQEHELWSATVVRTELLAEMRSAEEASTHLLLAQLRWQDLTVEIADQAGTMARRYLRSHRGVDTVDYVIAATTMSLGAELKTLNVKHFPMFAGLRRAYA